MNPNKLSKIPLRRIYSNDLTIHVSLEPCEVDGKDGPCADPEHWFAPHYGEWVDINPVPTLARGLFNDALNDKKKSVEDRYELLFKDFASRIVAWNWTDMAGNPLPAPNPDLILCLSGIETQWLQMAVYGRAGTTENVAPNSDSSVSIGSSTATEEKPQKSGKSSK